ncbi:bifunctional methylenetetrahydrofolate dehydrogenase/methenyltetrahydrofolate cyclohydrolase FolD, partial [Tateyamaria sp.]
MSATTEGAQAHATTTEGARARATTIDGKAFAADVRAKVADHVTRLKNDHGITPGLAVILVGEDPASEVYVAAKHKQTVEVGMASFEHRLPSDVSQDVLFALIDELNADATVHGILCQFPVPDHLDERAVVARIDPAKDVDGLSVVNAGLLASGETGLVSCTPLGCLMLLRDQLGNLSGLEAVVIGRSNLFGKPMGQLLLRENCTVTIAHSRTKDLAEVCRRADILVAAVGRAEMVKADWIKPGATVIDVGITRIPHPEKPGKSKLLGDVHFA